MPVRDAAYEDHAFVEAALQQASSGGSVRVFGSDVAWVRALFAAREMTSAQPEDSSAAACVAIETARWARGSRAVRRLRTLRDLLGRDGVVVLTAPAPDTPSEAEIHSTVQMAGLRLERFEIGSQRLRIVARRVMAPPDSLAASIWGTSQDDALLDLRYAPDEAELLDPQPAGVWRATVADAVDGGAHLAEHYPVDDPFGGIRGRAAVSTFFSCRLDAEQVTFGAGVSALLDGLADLADGGSIASPSLVHADLESRAFARGHRIRNLPDAGDPSELIAALRRDPPALLHLDRPTFTGELVSLDALSAIVLAAASVDAVVVIDEAAATYLDPTHSAATLVTRTSNLVVVRGFTKAYTWGGLRVGFAVASRAVAARVRSVVTPMQVSGPALAASLRLLQRGDCCARLRWRIRLMKPRVLSVLHACGLKTLPGHPDLPWIATNDDRAATMFAAARVRPLYPVCGPRDAPPVRVMRITIPLSEPRFERFGELMSISSGRPRT